MTNTLALTSPSGAVSTIVDLASGGRLSSLRVDNRELLITSADLPIDWGLYPMVPFAGRVRNGLLEFDEGRWQLPPTHGPHAMHGYGYVAEWTTTGASTLRYDFASPWPWTGYATQAIDLLDDSITLTLTVHAGERQPVQLGWHPWFRRDIGTGQTAELHFSPGSMFERGADGIPSGRLIDPGLGPWDDCFTGLSQNPRISWGNFEVSLESSTEQWTVYNQPPHALCVEPQTGPPNQINDEPLVLEAGEHLRHSFTLRFSRSQVSESETRPR